MREHGSNWISAGDRLPAIDQEVVMKFDNMRDELAWRGDIREELEDLKP